MRPTPETEAILLERFGGDSLIALATCVHDTPFVRTVNAFYLDGCFYVLTHALSGKMKQLAANPLCAVSGDWFTAHGNGEALGWFCKPENKAIAEHMRSVFAAWIDNGHNDFSDPNTCILRIRLKDAVLFHHGTCYRLEYE
jgi:hypothetical protein